MAKTSRARQKSDPPRRRSAEPVLLTALRLLLGAFDRAAQQRRSVWEFAVTRQRLVKVGLTTDRLRWLLDEERVLQRLDDFVLTASGVAWARAVVEDPEGGALRQGGGTAPGEVSDRPRWASQRRELTFRRRLVKRYRRRAPNQELILAALEEEGWPPAVDDPLPKEPGILQRERLHEAVRGLNRGQQEARIRFELDGSGSRVIWEVVGEVSVGRRSPPG